MARLILLLVNFKLLSVPKIQFGRSSQTSLNVSLEKKNHSTVSDRAFQKCYFIFVVSPFRWLLHRLCCCCCTRVSGARFYKYTKRSYVRATCRNSSSRPSYKIEKHNPVQTLRIIYTQMNRLNVIKLTVFKSKTIIRFNTQVVLYTHICGSRVYIIKNH